MRLCFHSNGVSLRTTKSRWDYWLPRKWVPLSVRDHMHWWGAVTRRPHRAAPTPEESPDA